MYVHKIRRAQNLDSDRMFLCSQAIIWEESFQSNFRRKAYATMNDRTTPVTVQVEIEVELIVYI